MNFYKGNIQWKIIQQNEPKCHVNEALNLCTQEIKIQRNSEKMIAMVIKPALALGFLMLLSFFIPHDSSDRLSIAMTMILAYCCFRFISYFRSSDLT